MSLKSLSAIYLPVFEDNNIKFKTNIQNKKYEYTMVKGHLWLEMEISLEP